MWEPLDVGAGSVLAIGTAAGPGLRPGGRGPRRHRRADLPRQRLDVHPRRLRRPRWSRSGARRRAAAGLAGRRGSASGVRRGRGADPHRWSDPAGSPAAPDVELADRRHRGSARGTGVLHPRRHRHALRDRLRGALQLRPHRRAPHGSATDVGAQRRRRGRPAPVQHPRHAVRRRRSRLHRRHPDHPGPGRPVARRIRLPGGGRQRRPVEARAAAPRRHRAVRADPRGRRRRRSTACRGSHDCPDPRRRRRRRRDRPPRPAGETAAGPPSRTGATATTTCWSSTATWSSTWGCGCGCTR